MTIDEYILKENCKYPYLFFESLLTERRGDLERDLSIIYNIYSIIYIHNFNQNTQLVH